MNYLVFHLLNDFSGSPRVLKGVVRELLAAGHNVHLFTSSGGVLDSLDHPNLRHHTIPYRFSPSNFATLCRYFLSQILSFLAVLRFAFSRNTRIYINTILPIGAAFGATITGRRFDLHCHEIPQEKSRTYRFLSRYMNRHAERVICVSDYQASQLSGLRNISIRHNTIDPDIARHLHPDPEAAFERKRVLMITSLKDYKGIPEFINLAFLMPDFKFSLVINEQRPAIDAWLSHRKITPPSNLAIFTHQEDVAPFYNTASILLNLSNPRMFVESFGMTVLEALECRLPVIVPEVGGVADLVAEGVNGFHIDCADTPRLMREVTRLLTDRPHYLRIAAPHKAAPR